MNQDNLSYSQRPYIHLLHCCQAVFAATDSKKILEVVKAFIDKELQTKTSLIFRLGGQPCTLHEETCLGNQSSLGNVIFSSWQEDASFSKLLDPSKNYGFLKHDGQEFFLFKFKCARDYDYLYVGNPANGSLIVETFETCLQLLRISIEASGNNIDRINDVQHMLYVDDLTGLYNTRYLDSVLDQEISESQIKNNSFAILFIDVDRFKELNDSYGHTIGSKLLHQLGNALNQCLHHSLRPGLRKKDILFRYGGDEFVALLSPCDLGGAQTVAEQLRNAIESQAFLREENLSLRVTISVGLALFPDHARTKVDILNAADHAMYSCKKKAVRNRVSVLHFDKRLG